MERWMHFLLTLCQQEVIFSMLKMPILKPFQSSVILVNVKQVFDL